jgi:hypothetical protein
LSHCYCYLPLSWKSWNQFEGVVGGIRHPQHTQTVDIVVCAPDDGWWYHLKHVEQFPGKINCVKLYLVGHILEYSHSSLSACCCSQMDNRAKLGSPLLEIGNIRNKSVYF